MLDFRSRHRFCANCGTPLCFSAPRWAGEIHILAGTLDDPASIAPRAHTFVCDQVPWAHIAPGDKRFLKTPKEGGPLP